MDLNMATTKKTATSKKSVAKKKETDNEMVSFKGKYISTIGRRKTAVAQIRLYTEGEGKLIVNGKELVKYFPEVKAELAVQPLKAASHDTDMNMSVLVKGGGTNAQAEAIRHGIARALLVMDEEYKGMLKSKGWLTRDSRKVERKKFGLKKARRAPQWSKR
jgi:small subunit ribosomal protein S9